MTSEITDKVFRYIIENPECASSDIAKKLSSNSQVINYHLNLLVNKGLVIKSSLHGINIYTCSVDEEKVKNILVELDKIIIKINNTISSSMEDKSKAKEVTKQIVTAYIDVLIK